MECCGRLAILVLSCVPLLWGTTAVTVTSVSPQQVQSGDPVTLQITGVPAGLVNSATVTLTPVNAAIGSAVTFAADSVTSVPGSNDRKINFHIPAAMGKATAYPATVIVLAGSGATQASSIPTTIVINPDATIVGLAPAAGTVGTAVTVAIHSAFTNFLPTNVTGIAFSGSGIAASIDSVVDTNTIQAKLQISSAAPLGAQTLTLTLTGGKTLTLPNVFTVMPRPARTASIVPATCTPLQSVSTSYALSGVGIGLTAGETTTFTALGSQVDPVGQASKGFIFNVACDTKVKGSTETITLIVGNEYTVVNLAILPVSGAIQMTPNVLVQGTTTAVTFQCLTGTATPCFPLPSLPLQIGLSNGGTNNPSVSNISANGSTITALVTVPATAPTGGYNVSLSNGAQTVSKPNGLTVAAGTPAISTVSPPGSTPGTSLNVVVAAKFFTFAPPVTADFGPGITVNSPGIAVNGSQVTIPIAIAANAALTTRQISITSQGVTLKSNFTVVTATATTLLSISPNTGVQGTSLAVTVTAAGVPFAGGTTFGISNGTVGADATGITVSAHSLSGALPLSDALPTGTYAVLSSQGSSSIPGGFVVTPLTKFLGTQAVAQGTTANVTLTGDFARFSNTTTVSSSSPDITIGAVSLISSSKVTVPVTVSPTAGLDTLYTLTTSTVLSGVTITSFATIAVTPGSAAISVVLPILNSGPQTVSVFGSNTHFAQGKTQITMTCPGFQLSAPATVQTATSLTFAVNLGSGRSDDCVIRATTLGEIAATQRGIQVSTGLRAVAIPTPQTVTVGNSFSLTVPPDDIVTKTAGFTLGEGVTITSILQAGSNLVVNGSVSPLATPGTRDLIATNGGASSKGSGALTILSNNSSFNATPGSVATGATVTVNLTGVRTNWIAGISSAVNPVNLTVNSLTVTGPTTASVSITAGAAGSGSFTIQTLGETAPGQVAITTGPGITSIAPSQIPRGAVSTVTISGQNTNFTAATTVSAACGGTPLSTKSTKLNADGTLSVSFDVPAATNLGACTVTAGALTAPNLLVIGRGAPVILSLKATNALQGATATISLQTRDLAFDPTLNATFDLGAGLSASFAGNAVEIFSFTMPIPVTAASGVRTATVTQSVRSATSTLTITPAPPTLTTVTPLLLPRAQTVAVSVTGINTGITVSTPVSVPAACGSAAVASAAPDGNSAVINIQVSATAAVPSPCPLTIGQLAPRTLNVTRGTPAVLSIASNLATPGQSATFTIATRDLAFNALDPVSIAIGGVAVNGTGLLIGAAQETFTATFAIALPGTYDLKVTQDTRTATLPQALLVSSSAISVSPTLLPRGRQTVVTVTGTGVTFTLASQIQFSCGSVQAISVPNSTTMRVTLFVNASAAFSSTCTATFSPRPGTTLTSSDATVGRGVPTVLSVTPNVVSLGTRPSLTIVTRDLMLVPFSVLPFQITDASPGPLPAVFDNSSTPAVTAVQESVTVPLGLIPITTALNAHNPVFSQGNRSDAAGIGVNGISAVSQTQFQRGTQSQVFVSGAGFDATTAFTLTTTLGQTCGTTSNAIQAGARVLLSITIPATAPLGACSLNAPGAGSFALTVTRGTPRILDISPTSLIIPGFSTFTVHTMDLLFAGGAAQPTINMGGSPSISGVQTIVPNDGSTETLTLTATFTSATPGNQSITITAGSATATLPNAFALNGVSSLSQTKFARGAAATTVVVSGFGLNPSKTFTLTNAANQSCGTVGPASGTSTRVQVDIAIPQLTPLGNCTLNTVTAGGFGISVVRGAPKILDVQPASLPQGGSSTVTVHTVDLLAASSGSVSANFGADIAATVSSSSITDPIETISVSASVSAIAAAGSRNVSVTSGSLTASLANGFAVTAGTSAITSIVPSTIPRGAKTSVTISGVNTGFSAQSFVSASCGTVSNLRFNNAALTVDIAVDPAQPLGLCSIGATTPAGPSLSTATLLTVVTGTPTLLSLTPDHGPQGVTTAVQLFTRDFVLTTESITASPSPDVIISVAGSNTALQGIEQVNLNLQVSALATVGSRQITLAQGSRALSFSFTITVPPAITLNPSNVPRGKTTLVTAVAAGNPLSVSAFQSSCGSPGALTQVDSATVTISLAIATSIPLGDCPVRFAGFPTAHLTVTSGDPAIVSVIPSSGTPGQTANLQIITRDLASDPNLPVTVTVDDYSATAAGSAIGISTSQETFSVSLAVPATALIGNRNLTVTQGTRSATLVGGFEVNSIGTLLATPSVTILDTGFTQTITLTASGAHFQASTTASFGDSNLAISNLTILSATSLRLDVTTSNNASTGGRSLILTTGGETVRADLNVSHAAVFGVGPPTLPRGKTTTLSITAIGFDFVNSPPVVGITDQSSSSAGITLGPVTPVSFSNFTIPVTLDAAYPLALPAGITPLTISINIPGSSSSLLTTDKLTAGPGDPKILSISPTTVTAGATGIPVTIVTRDVYINAASGPLPSPAIDLGTGLTLGLAASLTRQTTQEVVTDTLDVSPSATGVHSVVISSPQSATLPNAITVSTSTVSSVSPNTSPQKQTATVTFTVSNLSLVAPVTIAFSDPRITVRAATINILSTTQVSAVVDVGGAAALGKSDVIITSSGVSAVGSAAFTVTPGTAVVSALNPPGVAQGVTVNISVTGTNTSFEQGVTTASFGAGITVNSVTVQSQTSAIVNLTSDPSATNGTRTVTLTTGGEIATLANVFQVGLSPDVSLISPNAVGVGLTTTVRVTGGNIANATFSFPLPATLPSFCGQDTPAIACTAPTAAVVSNDGATAVLTVTGGSFTGDFALVITSSGGSTSSVISDSNRFTVVSVNTAFVPAISGFNNLIDQSLLPVLAPGTNTARSADVSVYDQLINQTLLPALPAGENNAYFPAVSDFNKLIDQSLLPRLAVGTNSALSADVSLFNGLVDQSLLPRLAAGTNSALSANVSVSNGLIDPSKLPALPAGSNQASFLPVSVHNNTTSSPSLSLPSPASFVQASGGVAQVGGLPDAQAEEMPGAFTAIAGQTLRLTVNGGNGEIAELRANGVTIRSNVAEAIFTVPYGVEDLALQWWLRGQEPSVLSNVRVSNDAGSAIHGVLRTADGKPEPDLKLAWSAGAFTAEVFAFKTPLTSLPDLTDLRPQRVFLATAINQPNPDAVFGADPLGLGTSIDVAVRYRAQVLTDRAGLYRFWLRSNGFVSLRVGGQRIQGEGELWVAANLEAGLHDIEVVYAKGVGPESLELSWAPPVPGATRQPLAPTYLRTAGPGSVRTNATGSFTLPAVPLALDTIWIEANRTAIPVERRRTGATPMELTLPDNATPDHQ